MPNEKLEDRRVGSREQGEVALPTNASALYELMIDSIRDYAIFALDARGHIASWNPGAQRLKGWTADEIIGRHLATFYPPEDVATGKPARLLAIAERDGHVQDEGWRVRKDGSRFWANVVITALRDRDGRLVGFTKVTRDETDRRAAERALAESEERFRLLVESVKDYGIFMLDPQGRVVSWNPGAERINGYTAAEIIGRHFSTFYPNEDVARGKPAMELRVASQEGRYEEEGWRVRQGGSLYWASVTITAVIDADDRLVGFAKVVRDLTERRAAQERALADARRIAEVEAANRAKSEFLATMSHELRTPLNAIGGYTELLTMGVAGPVTPDQLDYLGRVRRSQQHLLGIINDLLNYSRMEAGQVTYDIGSVAVDVVVDAVLPMIEPQAETKGVALTRGPHDEGLFMLADAAKMEQILLNLLSNAVKFTDAGGIVTVAWRAVGGDVELSVADTGMGIPHDKLESVFEPFVQVGRSHSRPHEGTGLGLAISRDLARAMGGDIRLSSEIGKGSIFTVRVPAAS